MTSHTDIRRFGEYVVPFDITPVSRGFVFDGDSCVADLDLPTAARHDYDYLTGARKLSADLRYTWGHIKDQRPLRAVVRLLGLSVFGWGAYLHHAHRRKEYGLDALLAERMVPHAADDYVWDWGNPELLETWLLEHLHRRTI